MHEPPALEPQERSKADEEEKAVDLALQALDLLG